MSILLSRGSYSRRSMVSFEAPPFMITPVRFAELSLATA